MNIRIGTRGSKLALWQAEYVKNKLEKAGHSAEIKIIETKGDKILDVAISKIGSKGVFTEEIEAQLAEGNIDIAVHSAKDMQSELPTGFELIAFTEREKVNDVLVSHKDSIDFYNKENPIVIGTSSTRRIATLKHFYPHVKTVDIRGNLQTRIRKMEEGLCDAILLAYAGVHRMNYDEKIKLELSTKEFIPAVGQGSVAIEVHKTIDQEKKDILRFALNHKQTEYCLRAERAYLKYLQGGCSIPVFGLAQLEGNSIEMEAGIISLNGKERISLKLTDEASRAEELGNLIAKQVLKKGGDKILKEIREQLSE
ncbi:hydroxymethylbilane synthase [Marivirga arenosa]|uniref:Porphobilinogen deaminase n=1 Tax=Marivirga arenosa TaxID=3059076 RepID=A0AA51RDY0_9BACT|nr:MULTISPECIES: hydroxymethylbilane synthase [unclassified Marivirga]WMN08000.1 hydroxymethylbilane synthase [Marivirga sp. ABR2-2]WNB17801.1 hydroxymethylbilane synthase [Marivirga sp. BKB1-2]